MHVADPAITSEMFRMPFDRTVARAEHKKTHRLLSAFHSDPEYRGLLLARPKRGSGPGEMSAHRPRPATTPIRQVCST